MRFQRTLASLAPLKRESLCRHQMSVVPEK
jgi:hypothetical protein